jgi:hypothetical protein
VNPTHNPTRKPQTLTAQAFQVTSSRELRFCQIFFPDALFRMNALLFPLFLALFFAVADDCMDAGGRVTQEQLPKARAACCT